MNNGVFMKTITMNLFSKNKLHLCLKLFLSCYQKILEINYLFTIAVVRSSTPETAV